MYGATFAVIESRVCEEDSQPRLYVSSLQFISSSTKVFIVILRTFPFG